MTRWFCVSVLLTLLALGASFYVGQFRYDDLPEQVPIHWNIHGQPDGFVPKSDVFLTFLLLPAVMAGMLALTLVLPWLSPKSFDVERFRGVYGYIMMLATALLGFIHAVSLWGSLHPQLPLDRLLIGGLFAFFALIGNVLGKVKRNFWIGVRTPWTLASEQVWNETHRLTAWLWVGVGVAAMVALLCGVPVAVTFVALMVAALYPILHSLLLYKRLERAGKLEATS